MRLFTLIVTLLAATAATAQSLLVYGDNALPQCAQQCGTLQSAQGGCLPPSAPVTDATIYESCFCQSGYLTTLKAAGSTVCADVCGPDDLPKIATWYQSNCADNGVAAAAAVDTVTPTSSSSLSSTSTSISSSSSSSSSSSPTKASSSSSSAAKQGSWWDLHYKWIVMLIVVFVGFALLTLLLVYLRRRYHRRQDRVRAPFNSGITHHSMPAPTSTQPVNTKAASRTSLPKVREMDRMGVKSHPLPPLPQNPEMMSARGGTPDVERGNGKMPMY